MKIIIEKRAEKFIRSLPASEGQRILKAIYKLPSGDVKKMKGHSDLMRLRVGDYRIIYTIDNGNLTIIVIDIGSRGQIYNRY